MTDRCFAAPVSITLTHPLSQTNQGKPIITGVVKLGAESVEWRQLIATVEKRLRTFTTQRCINHETYNSFAFVLPVLDILLLIVIFCNFMSTEYAWALVKTNGWGGATLYAAPRGKWINNLYRAYNNDLNVVGITTVTR